MAPGAQATAEQMHILGQTPMKTTGVYQQPKHLKMYQGEIPCVCVCVCVEPGQKKKCVLLVSNSYCVGKCTLRMSAKGGVCIHLHWSFLVSSGVPKAWQVPEYICSKHQGHS